MANGDDGPIARSPAAPAVPSTHGIGRGRAVVVGAGIVGAAVARALAAEGLAVTVLESGIPAGGATGAGMGHLVVMDDSEAQFALTRRSRELWDRAAPAMPAGCEMLGCGTMWVAADDEEMAGAEKRRDWYVARGVEAELVTADGLRRWEPSLRAGLAGGLRVPGDAVIYQPAATEWLLSEARSRGATVRTEVAVAALEAGAVRLADGTRVEADIIVNAAGRHAGELTSGLPIRPRKGHLVITDRHPGRVRHQLVELGYLKSAHGSDADSVAFNVQPRPNGQLLVGSSRQFDRTDPAVEPAILARMVRRAAGYMPALMTLSAIRVWTGFRAATPDSLPLVGPWPAVPGLWIAAGHEGLGITTSLATGELLADLLTGRTPRIPADCYRPDRKAGKHGHH